MCMGCSKGNWLSGLVCVVSSHRTAPVYEQCETSPKCSCYISVYSYYIGIPMGIMLMNND